MFDLVVKSMYDHRLECRRYFRIKQNINIYRWQLVFSVYVGPLLGGASDNWCLICIKVVVLFLWSNKYVSWRSIIADEIRNWGFGKIIFLQIFKSVNSAAFAMLLFLRFCQLWINADSVRLHILLFDYFG